MQMRSVPGLWSLYSLDELTHEGMRARIRAEMRAFAKGASLWDNEERGGKG